MKSPSPLHCTEMNRSTPRLMIVLLAAGAGSRFGSAKQLAQIDGQCLLQKVINTASTAHHPVTVITGAHKNKVHTLLCTLANDFSVIHNVNWQLGLSSSIRLAVEHLTKSADGLLFIAADQVALSPRCLRNLIDAWYASPNRTVCASYADQRGIPAIFPADSSAALLTLQGDKGAKVLLEDPAVIAIDLPSAAIDIDYPEDLASE